MSKVKLSLVDELLDDFAKIYEEERGYEFIYTNRGKEFKYMGMLLSMYRKKNPESDTEKCRKDMQAFFRSIINISDGYIYENLCPTIIYTQLQKIRVILNDGKQKSIRTGGKPINSVSRASELATKLGQGRKLLDLSGFDDDGTSSNNGSGNDEIKKLNR